MKAVKFSSLILGVAILALASSGVVAQTATPAPATTTTTTPTTTTTTATPAPATVETTVTTTPASTTVEVTASNASSRKDKMNAGALAFGYYEHSTFESLYVDFTADSITATGLGFKGFFEYGLSNRLAVGGSLGFSYLLDANFDTSNMSRSFWALDALGTYYFTDYAKKLQPYVVFGGGVLFSDRGLSPILDLGVGTHYKIADNMSLKLEILGKSGVIHNRAEAGVGMAFFF